MSKSTKSNKPNKPLFVKVWDKVIGSEFLPILWGTLILIAVTTALSSLAIVSARWLLSLFGVIV